MLKLRSRCVIVFVFQYPSLFHYRLSGLIGPISNDIGFFSFFVPESPIRLILFTDKKKSVIFFFYLSFLIGNLGPRYSDNQRQDFQLIRFFENDPPSSKGHLYVALSILAKPI